MCTIKKTQKDRVNRHRFSGSCRSGHQQMGHRRNIDHNGLPVGVLAKRNAQYGIIRGQPTILKTLPQPNDGSMLVRNLNPNSTTLRNRGDDSNTTSTQTHREIILERRNAADLDASCGLKLKECNNWSWMNLRYPTRNIKVT